MSEQAIAAPHSFRSVVREIGWAIVDCYRRGWRACVKAPVLVLMAIIPEFAQHVIEIHLGMFQSVAVFRAHAYDPLRWVFGIPKLVGFVAAILLTARYWSMGSVRSAFLIPPRVMIRVAGALLVCFALAVPFDWLHRQGLPLSIDLASQGVSLILQAGVTVYLVGALLQDPANDLLGAFTRKLPSAAVMTLLLVLTFGPGQAMHLLNHKLASGQPWPIVWGLMIFDALWIGLFTALVGSSLFVSFRSGLTWRGWGMRPSEMRLR